LHQQPQQGEEQARSSQKEDAPEEDPEMAKIRKEIAKMRQESIKRLERLAVVDEPTTSSSSLETNEIDDDDKTTPTKEDAAQILDCTSWELEIIPEIDTRGTFVFVACFFLFPSPKGRAGGPILFFRMGWIDTHVPFFLACAFSFLSRFPSISRLLDTHEHRKDNDSEAEATEPDEGQDPIRRHDSAGRGATGTLFSWSHNLSKTPRFGMSFGIVLRDGYITGQHERRIDIL